MEMCKGKWRQKRVRMGRKRGIKEELKGLKKGRQGAVGKWVAKGSVG